MPGERGAAAPWRLPDWAVPWPGVVVGYLLLAVPPVVLFGFGVWGTVLTVGTAAMGPVIVAGAVGIGLGVRYEWWEVRRVIEVGSATLERSYATPLAVVGGTVVTYAGVVELGLTPVVSAGVVGVAAALVVPSVAVPVYCGAFVGMTSPGLFGSFRSAVLAALVASVLFVLVHPVYKGVGGKLGTTAFVGATGVVLATRADFLGGPIPGMLVIASVVALSVLGAVVTFAIHTRGPFSPVFASGLVGAAGGTLLTATVAQDGLLAAALFAASFAGMSNPKRIPDERWIALTGVGVGLVVVYTTPFLGGSGGKLGTIAFGACLGVHGVLRRVDVFRLRRRRYRAPRRETT